jgi:SAM-dependent methyltransferase
MVLSNKYFNFKEAKDAFENGENVTTLLRKQKNIDYNTPEIIEIAYDLQAGEYIAGTERNPDFAIKYASECNTILDRYVTSDTSLLDIGTGEMTTLSMIIKTLKSKPKNIYAFDISWSRIWKGISFAKKHMGNDYNYLTPFVADIQSIPIMGKSMDITISNHALEPNGGREKELLKELFRVTKDILILFEPSYELNSPRGKKRMDSLGYIKNIKEYAQELGGEIVDQVKMQTVANPLNPTVCHIINPPSVEPKKSPAHNPEDVFSLPGTSISLERNVDGYFAPDAGMFFPSIKNIPILRSDNAVYASAFNEE